MPNKFISTIKKRLSGTCNQEDLEYYFDSVTQIIERVYIGRFSKGHRTKLEEDERFFEFRNLCWDRLEEDEGIIWKVGDKCFINDGALCRFFEISFSRLLEEKIVESIPGLETRKKQVSKILNEYCDKIEYKGNLCWKFKSLKHKNMVPASLDKLFDASKKLTVPKLIYTAKRNTERGPSISREAMKEFLLGVLKHAGGFCKRSDMIELIKEVCNIKKIETVEHLPDKDGREKSVSQKEQWITVLEAEKERLLLSQEHVLLAGRIYKGMDMVMRKVFYMLHVKGLSGNDAARAMCFSNSKISRCNKDIELHFRKYFSGDGDLDEFCCVQQLVEFLVKEGEESK